MKPGRMLDLTKAHEFVRMKYSTNSTSSDCYRPGSLDLTKTHEMVRMKYSSQSSHSECYSPGKSPSVIILSPFIKSHGFDYPGTQVRHAIADDSPSNGGIPSNRSSDAYMQVGPYQPNRSTVELVSMDMPDGRRNLGQRQLKRQQRFEEEVEKADPTFISKCSFYILVAMVVISTIMAIGASVIMVQLWAKCNALEQSINTAEASYTSAQKDPAICIPCEELVLGPFEEDNVKMRTLIQKNENHTNICCAKTSTQIATLLNLFAKHKQLAKCAQEVITGDGPGGCNNTVTGTGSPLPPAQRNVTSAHLLVGPQSDKHTDENNEQPVRNWLSDQPGTHLTGIQLTGVDNDRLIIPETGIYFVYSQVGFLIYYDDTESIALGSQTLFHKLFRFNHIYPNNGLPELLRSEITQCWEQNKQYGRYTSYLGASIHLNRGDQLYISVSRIKFLSRESPLSYFGLYKIN